MRRYLLTTSIAAFLIIVAPATGTSTPGTEVDALESAAVAVQHMAASSPYVRDEVAMVIIGTALIGLAAAVRRARFD
jgi:hypothetical protein